VVELVPAAWDASLAAYAITGPLHPGNAYLPSLTVTAGVELRAATAKCPPAWGGHGGGSGPCVLEYAGPPSSRAAADITWCRYRECRIEAFAGSPVVLRLGGVDRQQGGGVADRVRSRWWWCGQRGGGDVVAAMW
jgi:hypothetical protein